jgi:hypothetical protein
MIPIIINNRDLLTWPKKMVEKIATLKGAGEIFIIDNGSTYPALLDWYETKPCEIIRVDNLGHQAPWLSGIVKKLNKRYVVSDSDLGIDDLPDNTLLVLNKKLNELQGIGKIGLKLDWESVTQESPYYNHLQNYERRRWLNSKIENGVYVNVEIDTTFALYNTTYYFIGGGSLGKPYEAKHYPWNFTHEERKQNEEFSYYINNSSTSSSYKTFLNL